jgi:hypothetical protein
MIEIRLPANHLPERRYIASVLFGEFLGLDFKCLTHEKNETLITLENGKSLVLADHFFGCFENENDYLDASNIPAQICWVKKEGNPFIPENDLPVIYGNSHFSKTENQVSLGADLLASAFFMLTRWEEAVCPVRDQYDRFPAEASLALQCSFLHRPVVNEYAETIWNILRHLGCEQQRQSPKYEFLLSHDVDMPRLWRGGFRFLKKLAGDFLKRRDLKEAAFSMGSFPKTTLGLQPDPFDTFNYLMDCSEKLNLRSHFFFMSGGNTAFDNFYQLEQPHIQRLIQRIHDRGHAIGIHPSFNTFYDPEQFKRELHRLNEYSPQTVKSGRQHFLRFRIPDTWQIWEDHQMEWDSTLYYAEKAGFRCGTCTPFSVFNAFSRKPLRLVEKPLTVMEGTFTVYQKCSPDVMLSEITGLIETVRKYGGTFVLLWHNSAFHQPAYFAYRHLYEPILELAKPSASS